MYSSVKEGEEEERGEQESQAPHDLGTAQHSARTHPLHPVHNKPAQW